MFNRDAQPAMRIPDSNATEHYLNGVPVGKEEPDIIRAARAYEDARRELQHLQEQREKINMDIKGAMERMDEVARHMVSIMQPSDFGKPRIRAAD